MTENNGAKTIRRQWDNVTFRAIPAGEFTNEEGIVRPYPNQLKIGTGRDEVRITALFLKCLVNELRDNPELAAFCMNLLQEEKVKKLAEYEGV
jgi:hypothetical protein